MTAICPVDLIAQRENERREFIRRVVTSGECFVAALDAKIIGYAVFNYTFITPALLKWFTSISIIGEAVRVRRW
jgi:hypothetical protein